MSVATAGSRGWRSCGITLLELLLVLAVLGLLLLLVMPVYSEQARKARRVVATAELMQLAARQEHFFVNYREYARDLVALGYSLPTTVGIGASGQEVTVGALYEISLQDEGAFRFKALARPVGQQAGDERCGSLGIDSDGVRTATGPGGLRECW